MQDALKEAMIYLFAEHCIGGKHIPEEKLFSRAVRWSSKKEKKAFLKGYRSLDMQGIIIRTKKRTGKGFEWHAALNPRKIQEIHEIIGDKDGNIL